MVPAAFPDLLGEMVFWRGMTDRLLLEVATHRGTSVEVERVRMGVPVHPRPREPRTPRQPAQVPVSRPGEARVHPDPPWDMFARLRATSATEEDA